MPLLWARRRTAACRNRPFPGRICQELVAGQRRVAEANTLNTSGPTAGSCAQCGAIRGANLPHRIRCAASRLARDELIKCASVFTGGRDVRTYLGGGTKALRRVKATGQWLPEPHGRVPVGHRAIATAIELRWPPGEAAFRQNSSYSASLQGRSGCRQHRGSVWLGARRELLCNGRHYTARRLTGYCRIRQGSW